MVVILRIARRASTGSAGHSSTRAYAVQAESLAVLAAQCYEKEPSWKKFTNRYREAVVVSKNSVFRQVPGFLLSAFAGMGEGLVINFVNLENR